MFCIYYRSHWAATGLQQSDISDVLAAVIDMFCIYYRSHWAATGLQQSDISDVLAAVIDMFCIYYRSHWAATGLQPSASSDVLAAVIDVHVYLLVHGHWFFLPFAETECLHMDHGASPELTEPRNALAVNNTGEKRIVIYGRTPLLSVTTVSAAEWISCAVYCVKKSFFSIFS